MAVGNHEFDFGRERLEKSRREAQFPWLSANILGEDGKPAFAPYIVKTVGGVRVGILGLTTRNVPIWEPPSHIAGLRVLGHGRGREALRPDPARQGEVRRRPGHHAPGFRAQPRDGPGHAARAGENQAYAIATEVPGIDLLLTGHTHAVDRAAPARADLGLSAGALRQHADAVRPRPLEKAGGRFEVAAISGKNLPMKEVAPDPEIVRPSPPSTAATVKILARTGGDARAAGVGARRPHGGHGAPRLAPRRPAGAGEGGPLVRIAPARLASGLAGGPADDPADLGVLPVREHARHGARDRQAGARGPRDGGPLRLGHRASQDGKPVWQRNPAVWGYNCDTLDGAEYALDPDAAGGQPRPLPAARRPARRATTTPSPSRSTPTAPSGGGGYGVWRTVRASASRSKGSATCSSRTRGGGRLSGSEANENWFLAPSLPEEPISAEPLKRSCSLRRCGA